MTPEIIENLTEAVSITWLGSEPLHCLNALGLLGRRVDRGERGRVMIAWLGELQCEVCEEALGRRWIGGFEFEEEDEEEEKRKQMFDYYISFSTFSSHHAPHSTTFLPTRASSAAKTTP